MTPLRHADGRVHFSDLKRHADCAAMVQHALTTPFEQTRPMLVGSIVDSIVFGQRGYAVYPGKVRNGREWETFLAAHPDVFIALASEMEAAIGAASAVMQDPIVRDLMKGRPQYQLCAQWEAHGLPRAAGVPGERGGFDMLNLEHPTLRPFLADLKVTSDTEPTALARHSWQMLWPAQLADYLEGARALGHDVEDAYLICVRAAAPHIVTVQQMTPRALDKGRRMVALWSERHRACEAAGAWPGYAQEIVSLDVPAWEEEEG